MNLCNKNYISYLVLLVGLICYCCYINTMQFIPATIVMSTSLLLWVAFNCYFDTFDRLLFSKILSISGIIISISIFFIFGIEEIPFPTGALIFHSYGIAISLLMILLSLLPVLFMDISSSTPIAASPQTSYIEESKSDSIDDGWEIATEHDLESGDYEIAA